MKKLHYFGAATLCLVVGVALGICLAVRTWSPHAVLPALNIPNMTGLSLLALLLSHYLAPEGKNWSFLYLAAGALCFGLLPWIAGFAAGYQALKLAAVGGVVFALVSWLFASILERISSGPSAKAAPILSAFGLFLAAQCFVGIVL